MRGLLDVAPDGRAHLVARGQLTVRHPTTPQDVTVSLGHAGYRLRPGHALRLMLAGSDAPEFVPAPGTGEHRWLARTTKPNTHRVELGPNGLALRLTVSP